MSTFVFIALSHIVYDIQNLCIDSCYFRIQLSFIVVSNSIVECLFLCDRINGHWASDKPSTHSVTESNNNRYVAKKFDPFEYI